MSNHADTQPSPASSAAGVPSPAVPSTASGGPSPATLPDETIAFAQRMFDLARRGDVETLGAALDAGLPSNLTNEKGDTLVMLAAYHGHEPLVRTLAGKGADVNRANDKGQTPLAGAVFKKEDSVVETLLEFGADPEKGSPTARQTAQIFGRKDLLDRWGGPIDLGGAKEAVGQAASAHGASSSTIESVGR